MTQPSTDTSAPAPLTGKDAEVAYVARMADVLKVSEQEVLSWLTRKPYADPNRQLYFLDLGQLMQFLPPVPARVLDLGVGPGWSSDFLARCGYSVLGLDIAPDMIGIARRRVADGLDLRFEVHDYERSIPEDGFDAVVLYDALHHAVDEGAVIANSFTCLKPGGRLITMEPGTGHSVSQEAREATERFGTTEKDMEYARQAALMTRAGFGSVRQYLRLNQLPLAPVNDEAGRAEQWAHLHALMENTVLRGSSSVVVATKDGGTTPPPSTSPVPGPTPLLRRLRRAFRALTE
jgi:SAM-dependent methyltransferase